MIKDIINIKNLFYAYGSGETRRYVLKDVSLNLKAGELAILSGPSGSGKTTLLTLLGGLRSPQEGMLHVLGQDLATLNEAQSAELRRRIGFVFQQHNLLKFLNAQRNVEMSLSLAGEKNMNSGAALAALTQVGLKEKAQSPVTQLSVGQKQRVSVARAMAHNPDLILADEPTASLDVESAQMVMELFRAKIKNEDKAGLIVTHDERMFSYADRIIKVLDGCVSEGILKPKVHDGAI